MNSSLGLVEQQPETVCKDRPTGFVVSEVEKERLAAILAAWLARDEDVIHEG